MTKQQFQTWAQGKLTDEQIAEMVKLLTRSELLLFKQNWVE